MLSPASLRANSRLGTDTAPRLRPGWGMQCAATSRTYPLGLKWRGGDHRHPQSRRGPPAIPPPHVWPWGGHAWHLCSGGSGGPALPGAGSRGRVAAGHSRRPALAQRPATPGTAACSSPGSDCPACISTAHAHLGEQPENSTALDRSQGIPWDNCPRPLTSHEVSRLPLEPVWPWQATAGHRTPMLCSW